MPLEKIGYRRLYDPIGCSLIQDELLINQKIGDIEIVVYMGANPKRGIVVSSAVGKYIVPGESSSMGEIEYQKDASKSKYPRKFFTEIQCIKKINVPEELSLAFHNNDHDASNKVLELASADTKSLMETADLVAGIIGLRFHRQFVLEVINENIFAIKDDDDWAFLITGQWMENLESLRLNSVGVADLTKILGGLDTAPEPAREFGMSIFGWMLRAWVERDPISKFMALFIPLEIILSGYGKNDASEEEKKKLDGYNKIKNIISGHPDEDTEFLMKLFETLIQPQRPSLSSRFEQLANDAKLEGYKKHIAAFKRFNYIRNKMLHQGNPDVKLEVPITLENQDEYTQQLEDLVEKYVCWILFRDQNIYPSAWRKQSN